MKKITGNKVILRERREEDAEFFVRWFNTEDVMFRCGFTEPTTVEKERAVSDSEDRDWYTICSLDGNIVGETGLLRMFPQWKCTDLTIIIPNPDDRGKGYGSEAIRLVLQLAFEKYGMNRVAIGVVAENHEALRFYERVGFRKEGIQEQGYLYRGRYIDFVMMRILRSEWESSRLPGGAG